MDKTIVKKFAIFAKASLIESITCTAEKAGIAQSGISDVTGLTDEETCQRKALTDKIKSVDKPYEKAFETIVEEIAYTWLLSYCNTVYGNQRLFTVKGAVTVIGKS